jgi:hypothetical protein
MESNKWIPLKNYEGYYEINEAGEVRSLHKRNMHGIIEQHIDRGGYYALQLSKHAITTTHLVHRLLAETYIPNPDNKRCINHRNGNKLNNGLSNLEWVTHSENTIHAYSLGLCNTESRCKKVINTCTQRLYKSIKEAAVDLGIPYSTCKNMLNGNRNNQSCLRYAA